MAGSHLDKTFAVAAAMAPAVETYMDRPLLDFAAAVQLPVLGQGSAEPPLYTPTTAAVADTTAPAAAVTETVAAEEAD